MAHHKNFILWSQICPAELFMVFTAVQLKIDTCFSLSVKALTLRTVVKLMMRAFPEIPTSLFDNDLSVDWLHTNYQCTCHDSQQTKWTEFKPHSHITSVYLIALMDGFHFQAPICNATVWDQINLMQKSYKNISWAAQTALTMRFNYSLPVCVIPAHLFSSEYAAF